jgi:L-alanine-DL-glutamate epimerase-like enolase superfamily enzyme
LNHELNDIKDIYRIGSLVRENSLDLLQADHTFSGIDIALWDLLGKKLETPVWKLLGYKSTFSKMPYASQLFGDTPQETLEKARQSRAQNYRAIKFGWGPFGRGSVENDRDQLHAAREGLGADGILLVDAGTVWGHDIEAAVSRLPILKECNVTWLEEPFHTGALREYKTLAGQSGSVKLAGGEGSHNADMARHMMEFGGVEFIQIDTGRIGGITPAKEIADEANARGVTYVNHTFTSHLALSASLQPYAGLEKSTFSEYPVEPKQLAIDITENHLARDANGNIKAPDAPGLGMTIDTEVLQKYLVPVEINVGGKLLYATSGLLS